MDEKSFLKQLAYKINKLILLNQITRSIKDSNEVCNNLTNSQMLFLQFLKLIGTPNIRQLSEVMGSTSSFVSRLTTQLEDVKLVERVHKPKLRKEVFVELTNAGKRVVEQIEEFETRWIINSLKQISQDLGMDKTKVIEEVVNHLSNKIVEGLQHTI